MYHQYQNVEENHSPPPEFPLKVPLKMPSKPEKSETAENAKKVEMPSPTNLLSQMPHSASEYSSEKEQIQEGQNAGTKIGPKETDGQNIDGNRRESASSDLILSSSTSSSVTIRNEMKAGKAEGGDVWNNSLGADVEFSSDELENLPKGDAPNLEGANLRDGEDNGELFGPMQLARAHWIQLHKMDMQMPILRRMFLQLLELHPQMRALWPFSRAFDGTTGQLQKLVQGNAFRHFCQSYQATLTLLMDNLDDEPALCRLLQEFGSNHFFYDAVESHFRMMRIEFFNALVDCLAGSNEELDQELAEDWDKFWSKLESNMGFGLKVQRHNYLAHCLTAGEMASIREQWQKMMAEIEGGGGIGGMAERINANGVKNFLQGLAAIGLVGQQNQSTNFVAMFGRASRELLWAMDKALALWEPGTGFLRLCAEIDGKCADANELIRLASAPLIRRPFMEAFSVELNELNIGGGKKVGKGTNDQENAETLLATIHSWTKLYRVAEQAIIADELGRNGGK